MISIDKNGVITVREMTKEERENEMERMLSKARHDEAQAIRNATLKTNKKWERIIADKDAAHTAAIADKDAAIADKDALIAELREKLGEKKQTPLCRNKA